MLLVILNVKIFFSCKMFLTNAQVSELRKDFANNSLTNIKLLESQLHKLGQSGGFLGRLLGPLLKTGLPLIGSVIKSLAKSVLIPLGLTAAASATDADIHKTMFGSGNTTLIISKEEMDIMKIVKSIEESQLLIKGVSETIKNKAKEQKREFFEMLLGPLGASLLGNLLIGKGTFRTSEGTFRAGKGIVRAGQDF